MSACFVTFMTTDMNFSACCCAFFATDAASFAFARDVAAFASAAFFLALFAKNVGGHNSGDTRSLHGLCVYVLQVPTGKNVAKKEVDARPLLAIIGRGAVGGSGVSGLSSALLTQLFDFYRNQRGGKGRGTR